MNQITQAFIASGIKPPSQSERLCHIIKDNPRCTAAKARVLAKLPNSGTSSLLSQMVDRDMLIVEKQPKRVPGLRGFVERNVFHYSVHPRMNGKFEMLPAPVKSKPVAKVVPLKEDLTPKPAAVITQPTTRPEPPPAAPGVDIDHLTLGQARNLYVVLHKLFGGRV